MVREIDFKVFLDKNSTKVFKFEDDSGNDYDFTDTNGIELLLYKDPDNPISIPGNVDQPTAQVSFLFLAATHTNELGTFEYRILDNRTSGVIDIGRGNIIIEKYIPFSNTIEAFIESELPSNLTLTQNYINQRLLYWRTLLQSAFNIADSDVEVESAWPILVNNLFAKLIVYDSLIKATRGSFVQFLGGSYIDQTTEGGGGIKSVETGPTKVEYYDTATSAKQAFTATTGNLSMFDTLTQDICGLAKNLKVKLPMCSGHNVTISPKYFQNPDWAYPTLSDPYDGIERQSSQG